MKKTAQDLFTFLLLLLLLLLFLPNPILAKMHFCPGLGKTTKGGGGGGGKRGNTEIGIVAICSSTIWPKVLPSIAAEKGMTGNITQPPTVVCKMEAQLEYVTSTRGTHAFARLGTNLYAQSVHINKISASELSSKFIKGALLVGFE